jgi:peptidoglycan/LPS O-acetylase OafA/YrhL
MDIETSKLITQSLITEQSQSENSQSYIPSLDGWRAIAVSLVIGAHSYSMLMNNGSAPARSLALFFAHAGYGVDIFFALSGYLICTILLREKRETGTISMSQFYTRRAFRILPPMLLYLLVITCLSLLTFLPLIDAREVLAVVLFYRNYCFGTWYTGHFWSLAIEEHFYAVVPVFLLLFNSRRAMGVAFSLILLCVGIRSFEYSHGLFPASLLQFRTENRFDGLMWGAVLALALQYPTVRSWLKLRLNTWMFFAAIAASIVLLVEFDSQPERRTIVAAVMPILIGHSVLNPQSIVGRLLELSPLRWLGRISYSLYIWQMLFLVGEDRPLGQIQGFPFALILPLACAALSYYLVERPMIAFGRRLAGSLASRDKLSLFFFGRPLQCGSVSPRNCASGSSLEQSRPDAGLK